MVRKGDFSESVKSTLAKRVAHICSNPDCNASTIGPNDDVNKATSNGDAAHIKGALPGSARYDQNQSDEERKNIENGIWLCAGCHRIVDADESHYTVEQLKEWKIQAENNARRKQGKTNQLEYKIILKSRWCHETTDDDRYVSRYKLVARLNLWYNNKDVRVISITGIGGSGKTSLVGNWLKKNNAELSREVDSLFYWSFYSEKRVEVFIKSLCEYIEFAYNIDFKLRKNDPIDAFFNNFTKLQPMVLVLDGLEVLQEALSEGRSYGAFIDANLRDFIARISYAKSPWLCIITSRFPVSDLNNNKHVERLILEKVEDAEGADILLNNGVLGDVQERGYVSRFFEGHPLTLRIFSASIPIEYKDSPKLHLDKLFIDAEKTVFLAKLERLLRFYKERINKYQNAILSILSVFRSPITPELITELMPKFIQEDGDISDSMFIAVNELATLSTSGLLVKDTVGGVEVYSCHPIIRDYFRNTLLQENASAGEFVADFLSNRPDSRGLVGATNIEPILVAIDTLLAIKDVDSGADLYVNRLESGNVFIRLGLPKEGKRCFDGFVKYFESTSIKSQILRHQNLDYKHFLNGQIEFCLQLGEYKEADILIKKALKISSVNRRAVINRAAARLACYRGEFSSVISSAQDAVAANKQYYRRHNGIADELAIAYLALVKAYLNQGLNSHANKIVKEIDIIKPDFETKYSDSELIYLLVQLLCCISDADRKCVNKIINKSIARLQNVVNEYLLLDAKLIIAEAFIVSGNYGSAIKYAQMAYKNAVKKGWPYELCKSLYIIECANYMNNINEDTRISEILDISNAGDMLAINIDARYLYYLMQDKQDDFDFTQIQNLADSIGYVRYKKRYLTTSNRISAA